MLCPVCKVGLAMSDRRGVESDYRPGGWPDRGELDKVIERGAAAAVPAETPQTILRPTSHRPLCDAHR